ncbi:hypothetical protein D3C78_1576150 [compost metagenome]
MCECVPQIRSERAAEQRLNFEYHINSEQLLNTLNVHERAQTILVLNALAVSVGGVKPSSFHLVSDNVFHLGNEEMSGGGKITDYSPVEAFPRDNRALWWHQGRVLRKEN